MHLPSIQRMGHGRRYVGGKVTRTVTLGAQMSTATAGHGAMEELGRGVDGEDPTFGCDWLHRHHILNRTPARNVSFATPNNGAVIGRAGSIVRQPWFGPYLLSHYQECRQPRQRSPQRIPTGGAYLSATQSKNDHNYITLPSPYRAFFHFPACCLPFTYIPPSPANVDLA